LSGLTWLVQGVVSGLAAGFHFPWAKLAREQRQRMKVSKRGAVVGILMQFFEKMTGECNTIMPVFRERAVKVAVQL
jgi:hypothetical protein